MHHKTQFDLEAPSHLNKINNIRRIGTLFTDVSHTELYYTNVFTIYNELGPNALRLLYIVRVHFCLYCRCSLMYTNVLVLFICVLFIKKTLVYIGSI